MPVVVLWIRYECDVQFHQTFLQANRMNTLFASTFGHHPNTNCGKGFESLVKGSQDYRTTAMVKVYTHPWHIMDNATF